MSRRLDGRRFLITGAASGMGAEVARACAREGAALALIDRNAEGLAAIATETGAAAFSLDLTDRAAIAPTVAACAAHLGGIDGVINAAGLLVMGATADIRIDDWERMIAVNQTAPLLVVQAALPHLQAATGAAILNFCSVSSLLPMPNAAAYSATKAALAMMTKCMAWDLGPAIRVNGLCPGTVKTEMTRHIWENPEHATRASTRVALNRLGEPAELAKAAVFLMSDDSSFTTGSLLTVDGGFVMH